MPSSSFLETSFDQFCHGGMHSADRFIAMAALVDGGGRVEAIAARLDNTYSLQASGRACMSSPAYIGYISTATSFQQLLLPAEYRNFVAAIECKGRWRGYGLVPSIRRLRDSMNIMNGAMWVFISGSKKNFVHKWRPDCWRIVYSGLLVDISPIVKGQNVELKNFAVRRR